MFPACATLLIVLASTTGANAASPRAVDAEPDYDIFSFTPTSYSNLVWYPVAGKIPSTGRAYVGHVATFEASAFSFRPPTTTGCDTYIKTSISSAENWNCSYATNGGFFTV